jgi:hypothetical protein
MKLAKEMDITDLRAKSDSQLVTNQVSGEFQTKDLQLVKYLEMVRNVANYFNSFQLTYVPREQNARADLLSKLASTKKPGGNRTFIQETIANPSINEEPVLMIIEEEDWRAPIIRYLQRDELPAAREETCKLKKMAAWYSILGDRLYKRGFSGPLMLCVSQEEAKGILEEIHEGSCGSHIGARSLAGKILRAGFYWPELYRDAARYVKTCDKSQRFANLRYAPGEPLKFVLSPWPLFMWGTDILGPFPSSIGQAKLIIVAIDYFTKWVEAEALSSISAEQVKKFYWRKIICRFGLPKHIVSDNGTQFASEKVVQFCKEKGIQNTLISVEHPQANGQAESANKVILKAIKRRITSKDEGWVAHLLPILWSYHTTPQSSTGEAPFTMVYGTDAIIPAEINPPSWRRETITPQENSEALQENLDLVQELRENAYFTEFVSKQRATRRYNTRVIARRFKEGDLVLKRPMGKDKGGKLAANWEGPFKVNEAFEGGAYRLETMEGEVLHRTWNVANLRFYYS